MTTWLTGRFGLTVPIVGAPMAGVSGGVLPQQSHVPAGSA